MVRFDSGFLALLNHKKLKVQNSKEGFPKFTVSVSGVLSCKPSARLEKFHWPVMIVKLRTIPKNIQKIENNSKNCQNL